MGTALIIKDFISDHARMPVAKHQVSSMLENINKIIHKSKDFKVTVIRDAVASATDEKREKSLRKLATKGISVVDSSVILTRGSRVK